MSAWRLHRGRALVVRHHRPHSGTGMGMGTPEGSGSAAQTASATIRPSRRPATASPKSPATETAVSARPRYPAHAPSAPNTAKTTVTATAQAMFATASSPTGHPTAKLSTETGSRRIGR